MIPQGRRRVGTTSLEIPILGLGTCPLGGVYAAIGEAEARATYEAAWEGGIRLYDTAPWYGLGQAEHRTGRALYDRPRGDFVLTTKVGRVLRAPRDRAGFVPPAWQAPLAFEPHHVFTYDAIMRSYEDSLQRLGINQVEALYIHDLDSGYFSTAEALDGKLRELDQGGGYRALDELKRSGEVKAIGAGINERGMIRRFLAAADLDVFLVASRYTLLEHDIYADEIREAGKRVASVVVGGPFTMTMFVLEATGNFSLTGAVLAASLVSSTIVRELFGYSFSTWRFHLRGETIKSARDVGWMKALTAGRMMRRGAATAPAAITIAELRRRFPLGATSRVVLVDEDERYAGVVTIAAAFAEGVDREAPAATLAHATDAALSPDMDLGVVMKAFDTAATDELAVLDADGHVLGIVTETYVRRRYAEELDKAQRALFGEE